MEECRTPAELLDAVALCRVVITTSYHAAVFALARGIPVIGLTGSEYYDAKFEGLARAFAGALTVLPIREPELEQRLHEAIEHAWEVSDAARRRCWKEGLRQREAGRAFFDRVSLDVPNRPISSCPSA